VLLNGSGVEFAGFEVDGNFAAQQAIDYGAGIYNGGGGAGSRIHHNYIHHTNGSGIHIRGSKIEIYQNWIEWTENAQINLSHAPSFINVHHNTLRYAFNDGNLWLWKAHGITIEHNEMYAITQEALDQPSTVPGSLVGRWVPFMAKSSSHGWTLRKNKIYDSRTNGLVVAEGSHDTTVGARTCVKSKISHNLVENGGANGIQTDGNDDHRELDAEQHLRHRSERIGAGWVWQLCAPMATPPGVAFVSSPPLTIDTTFEAGASWSPFWSGCRPDLWVIEPV
jgi:hypothetical protein